MYYLNKIVGWVMSPLGMMFLGLGFAFVLDLIGRKLAAKGCWCRRLAKGFAALILVVTWILGCGVTTRFIGLPLEMEEVDESSLPSADAIVLLGGGMTAHLECGRAEMLGGADRAWMAARLWKAERAVRILCSGGEVETSTVPLLVDLGVPRAAITCFPDPRNTEEEAREYLKHFESVGYEAASEGGRPRILLVTSAWHMPRAKMLFERKAFEVVPAPTDYEMHCVAERPLEFGDFFPSADAMARNGWAIKEWVARLGYAVLRR